MPTGEEAQVFVNHLEFFVTVQILDDTLAVLSLGKLCEEHGFTNEWASGQKATSLGQNEGVVLYKTFLISFLFVYQDCHQARAQVRLPHRYRRTHRALLPVQEFYEVTIPASKPRETEAILPEMKHKKRTTIKQREVDCEISQSCWRSREHQCTC